MSFHCVFLPCSTSGSCAGILADTLHQSDNLFTSRRAGLVGGGWGENKRFMEKPCRPPCRPLCRPPCEPPCPPPCRPSCQAGLVEGGWGENKRFMEKRFTQGTDCRPLLFHKMSLEANKYNLECVTIGFGKGISLFCISCICICGIFVTIF